MGKVNEIDLLARTLWGEARGEGVKGMEAVAAVILNRVADPRRWGKSIRAVIHQPWQFSAWNAKDPNRSQMLKVNSTNKQFVTALRIARQAVNGELEDKTGGANHYHERSINPNWARQDRITARIGRHIFYKL